MLEISEKLKNKRQSLLLLADSLGVDLKDLYLKYPDEVFDRRMTQDLFKQALNLRFTDINSSRLAEICDIRFNRDVRSAEEYAVDLIFGWMVEDLIVEFLSINGFSVELVGVDRDRQFLENKNIKSDLDLLVNNVAKFDVYFDSGGYWNKTDRLDVRESKWKQIVNDSASIICVSNQGLMLVDSSVDYEIRQNPLWGGKSCATVYGVKSKLSNPSEFLDSFRENISNKLQH